MPTRRAPPPRARRRRWRRWLSPLLLASAARLAAAEADANRTDCWDTCYATSHFCPVFCCQPLDGIGNPTCWDVSGHFTYDRCCLHPLVRAAVDPPEPAKPPTLKLGSVVLPLYRGPSDYNSPKFNERTLEVALGLWFMRRCLEGLQRSGGGVVPVEVGNVLAMYWPQSDRLYGRLLPWQVFDLGDNGQDATYADFSGSAVLSISTVEHIGYDNEGVARVAGFRIGGSAGGMEAWVRAWDAGPALLHRIVDQAKHFLVTFPVGFNPHLDAVVSRSPRLRRLARVARRVDAANRWELDPNKSFAYGYDFRDTYDSMHVGYIYDPELPRVYERVFGKAMPSPPKPLPFHPPFRFANAVCVVTNIPELLG